MAIWSIKAKYWNLERNRFIAENCNFAKSGNTKSVVEGSKMKIRKAKTWQHEITGFDGYATLFGINIFDYEWKTVDKTVKVHDPLYGQEYVFQVYSVTINGQEYEFAAGEYSNCVWGFYVLKY